MSHRRSAGFAISLATVIALAALVGGAVVWTYSQVPIVNYSLKGPDGYFVNDANSNVPLQIAVQAQNTGLTDVDINVTLSAANATISTSKNGPYSTTLFQFLLVQAKSGVGGYPAIYVKVNGGVSVFSVKIVSVSGSPVYSTNPSVLTVITAIVVSQARYTPSEPQALQYVKVQPGAYAYELVQ